MTPGFGIGVAPSGARPVTRAPVTPDAPSCPEAAGPGSRSPRRWRGRCSSGLRRDRRCSWTSRPARRAGASETGRVRPAAQDIAGDGDRVGVSSTSYPSGPKGSPRACRRSTRAGRLTKMLPVIVQDCSCGSTMKCGRRGRVDVYHAVVAHDRREVGALRRPPHCSSRARAAGRCGRRSRLRLVGLWAGSRRGLAGRDVIAADEDRRLAGEGRRFGRRLSRRRREQGRERRSGD